MRAGPWGIQRQLCLRLQLEGDRVLQDAGVFSVMACVAQAREAAR
jgi:hypothetical protein